ncbi:hypothetical protein BsIDN1_71890 [Bacillus safensis]|uniref:ABC-type glycine betaine transport system substrate-binding domain-containing protein n=1 Tax=Bacillus safensis TaxID=561879 RepID=A0A5S9MKT0_BACIA|nr:hypothetical protein BsIDN1_71890 [Bacillus safensis]
MISVAVFFCSDCRSSCRCPRSLFQQEKKEITIGGKLGSEPEILISMYKLLIEQDTDIQVNLKPGLGKTSFVFQALRSGDIDIYPEFTGTAISEFLKETAKKHR